jgi:Coenzyme PQQ synthesis protein D (PqqD)
VDSISTGFAAAGSVHLMRLRVNAPGVIHETIDHEVVIINLDTGTYYSLEGTGEEIWTLLDQGMATEAVPEALLERYEAELLEIRASVDRFVDELRSESLVVPDSEPAATVGSAGARGEAREPFSPPQLERFTEMQQLIALDPIHEVNEGQGWPHT